MLLHINRAVYGSQGHGKDVANRLKAMVRNNRLDLTVDNDAMGDPNEHSKKTSKVDYPFGNRRQSRVVKEHDRLVLP
jgi:hypothetical protein